MPSRAGMLDAVAKPGSRDDSDLTEPQLLDTVHSGTVSTVHKFPRAKVCHGLQLAYYRVESISRKAIKTNIADSLHEIVRIDRRPGRCFVSHAGEIASYQSRDRHLTPTFHL